MAQLTQVITQEELLGWAAFFELRNEQEEKAMQRSKMQSRVNTM